MSSALDMLVDKIDQLPALQGYLTEEEIVPVLQYLGIPEENALSLKVIGRGTRAVVLWMPNRKQILKLTRDSDDAEVCAKLIGRRMSNLLQVSDVFAITNRVYGVIAEKLVPLGSHERELWNRGRHAIATISTEGPSYWSLLKKMGLTVAWIHIVQAALAQILPYEHTMQKAIANLKAILPTWTAMAEQFQAINVTKYADIHDGNIMMRGQHMVIVDFGTAQVASAPHIPSI